MAITINGTTGIAGIDGSVGTPAVQGTDTNTGVYFSAADTVDIATGGTQRGQFDSSGNFKFNSGYGSVATAYGCRAWVNFNGTGTVAISASGNVSSITDNNTGDYTVNFTNSLVDANYAVAGSATTATGQSELATVQLFLSTGEVSLARTTSAVKVLLVYAGTTAPAFADSEKVNVAIFR